VSAPLIPFGKPLLDQAEIDAVVAVLSGTVLVHGPITHEFEQRFAARIGAKHAVSVSSCTAALHLSLFANSIGPGDLVVVPAMTHVATAHAAEFCGARPVFVDVAADTGNLDPAALASAMSPAVRTVMPVHYLGLPCDMEAISGICERNGAFIVEDCALAIDADYDGRKVGTFGLTGCFSFYPIKHITSIEGGMVTTDDPAVAIAIRQRRAFGYDRTVGERTRPGIYDVTVLGYNYRMNEVEAAVGLAQLKKLDAFQGARATNFARLREALVGIDELTVFAPRKGKATSSHYCLNAVLPRDGSIDRDAVVARLNAAGIGTSVHYPCAVPMTSYYREKYGYKTGQFPVAEWLAAQTISLPIGPHLSERDMLRIGAAFKDAVHTSRAQ